MPDLVIEYSIDGGATWHHGRTVEAWVTANVAVLGEQRAAVRARARQEHGQVRRVTTRVRPEDDPRAAVNRADRRRGKPGGDYTLTITRQQLLDALADRGLITLGAGTGGAVWDDLASAAVSAPDPAPAPDPDLTPADDELSRQQAAEALAEWHAAMTDEGSLGDMLSAGQQMAEFIADWLDASRMPEGVDNPGYFGLGGPTA